jgi:hypothetical protein
MPLRLPLLILLLACKEGGKASEVTLSGKSYAPPWAQLTRFRALDQSELPEVTEEDIALEEPLLLFGWSETEGGVTGFWVTEGDDPSASTRFSIEVEGGLDLVSVNGSEASAPLLPGSFSSGDKVSGGGWTCTIREVKDLPTWYGRFDRAIELDVQGDQGFQLRLVENIGPVQWSSASGAGDLAWYDSAGE